MDGRQRRGRVLVVGRGKKKLGWMGKIRIQGVCMGLWEFSGGDITLELLSCGHKMTLCKATLTGALTGAAGKGEVIEVL